MKTYIVIKDFLDRFNNRKHMKPGDEHTPHDQDRADLLLSQGFIGPILEPPEPEKDDKQSDKPETKTSEKPKSSNRKPRSTKADKDDVSDDDESGKVE